MASGNNRFVWLLWASLVGAAVPVAAQVGTFRAAESFSLSGTSLDLTSLLAIADVGSNQGPPDGIADVITAGMNQSASVLYGTTEGFLIGGPNTNLGRIPTALAVADFTDDGFPDLVISDTGNNLLCYRGFSDGPPFELQGTPLRVGNNPIAFALEDLDGDGRVDLSVLHQGGLSFGEIWVLRSTGNCSFEPFPPPSQVIVATGAASSDLVLDDFNSDGNPDFAVTNASGNDVSIIHGAADGTFAEVQRVSVVPGGGSDIVEPIAIDSARLDGDALLDLVIVNRNSDQIAVARGLSAGRFAAPTYFATGSAGSAPTSLALADVDGDGETDALVANNRSNDASVLLGDGNGGFGLARSFVADQEPLAIAVASLSADFDTFPDVVVTSRGAAGPTATLLLGDGTGGFVSVENVATDPNPNDFAIGDLDADGFPDAVVVHSDGKVEILRSTGAGGMEPVAPGRLQLNGNASAVVVGDFDGDQLNDVVVANDGAGAVVLFAGRPGLQFAAPRSVTLGTGINALSSGDWTGDGRRDLAVLRQLDETSGMIEVLSWRADGVDGPFRTTVPGDPVDASPAHVNADGKVDMIVADITTGRALVMIGRDNGTFGFGTHMTAAGAVRSVAVADFDKDACDDVVLSLSQVSTVQPYFGNCAGVFTAGPQSIRGAFSPVRVAARDFSGDDVADVLIPDEVENSALLATKAAAGQFFSVLNGDRYATSRRPIRTAGADFNGDGRYDGAVLNSFVAGSLSILTNQKGATANRFDGNGDAEVTAADVVAIARELVDGDSERVEEAGSGFAGGRHTDADGDGVVSGTDLRSQAARLFPRS